MKLMKSQNGQDMVEYALMLAIIVGIGWYITSDTELQTFISYLWHDTKLMVSGFSGPQSAFPNTSMWTFWGKN